MSIDTVSRAVADRSNTVFKDSTRGLIRVLALANTGELRPFHRITNYWSCGRIHYGSFLVLIYANHHESAKYPFHHYRVVWFWYVLSGDWIVTLRLCHAA
jgi:hypothetical protein